MIDAQTETSKREDHIKLVDTDKIKELVVEHTNAVRVEIGDISAYKHMAMFSLMKLLEFHNTVGLEEIKNAKSEEECENAICWARDAGWLQTCINTLIEVGCGPNDWFANPRDDDDAEAA